MSEPAIGQLLDGRKGLVVGDDAEPGPRDSRVNALSPGPLKTRPASGIAHFDALIDKARSRAPSRRLVTIEDVGNMAAMPVSDAARNVTGNIAYFDAGYHVPG